MLSHGVCPKCGYKTEGEYELGSLLYCIQCSTEYRIVYDLDTRKTVSVFAGSVSKAAEVPKSAGVKHDGDKPALQYVPKAAMWQMGLAFGYGARKYGAWNFKNGLAVTRCLAAAVRHIFQFLAGENTDPESGHSHLGHAMASIAMAIDMVENHPELDDRYKKAE